MTLNADDGCRAAGPSAQPARVPRPAGPDDKPVLPEQSQEDTDAGWGEQPESDDDECFRRDRPPHWDSA
jgi:hypothetical protein